MKKLIIFFFAALPFFGGAQTLLPITGWTTDSTYIYGTFAEFMRRNFYVATSTMSTGDGYFLGINSSQNGLELRRNFRRKSTGTTLYLTEFPKVCLGADTTSYQLEAYSSGSVAAGIAARGNNNVSFDVWSSASSPNSTFNIYASRGTIASPTALQSGNSIGPIRFKGHDGTSYKDVSSIRVDVTGTVATNTFGAKFVFSNLRNGFGGMTDVGAFDNRGRLGIGTTSPGYWLDVVSGFNAVTALFRLQNTSDSVKAFVYNTANPNSLVSGRPGDFLFSNNTSKGALYIKGGSGSSTSDWNQTITNSGNTTGATMTIGSDDAFGVNVETNNTTRLRLDSGGRFFNGTLTDVVLTPSDSMRITGATVDIAGAVKITGAAAHVGDVDMNSYDFTEVDSLTSAGTITINSTASQIPLQVVGSFHSLSEFRSPNASGNAGIYLGNNADDNNTYGFYRIGNGNLILSMSNDYPFASEDDSIFHYNASTRVIDFRTSAIHLNGSPLAGTVGGAGQTNKLPVWTSSGNIGFESSMHVDTTNNRLGLGTATPDKTLGLGDGTDEFSISTASDKLTVWNDVSTPVAVVTIDSAGTLDAKGLKINGASILDGTWTPTLTNTLNVSASTAYACNYVRVGNTVTVSGRVDVDATATGSVLLEMSLPIASDFAAFENAGGTAAGTTGTVSAIYASHTNDRLVFAYTAAVTTNEPLHFSATYRIL